MKRLLFSLFFLFLPVGVSASEVYLTDFEVFNGTLSIPFQEKNNIYTVYMDSNAEKLEFSYHLSDDDSTVEILGNDYQSGAENVMTIKVSNKSTLESQSYTFYLEKEEVATASFDLSHSTEVNVPREKEIPHLKAKVIGVCGLFIFLLFKFFIWDYMRKTQEKS